MNPVLAWGIRLMEFLFVVGCVGSVIVILVSGIEDIETILGAEHDGDPQQPQAAK